MNPQHHAVLSAAAVLIAGIATGLQPQSLATWLAVGILAGVLVDADHFPRAMLFNRRIEESLYWLRHPVAAVINPGEMIADTDPQERLRPHRLASHTLILVLLVLLSYRVRLLTPAAIAVAVHIAADIAWDVYEEGGVPYI